jgi:hypothetical protein
MSSAQQKIEARRNVKKSAADEAAVQRDDQEGAVDETDDGPESAPGDTGEGPDSPRRG